MPGSILTVALNAAVDVSYVIPGFEVNRINSVTEVVREAGGKANNVARVLAGLGERVVATGFAGGAAGRFIRERLSAHGIQVEYEETAGENRTCTAIVDPSGTTLTEVREKGPALDQSDADRFLLRFRRLVRQAEFVVISGSLPPGIPSDYYSLLVGEAYRTAQVRTIVDAAGAALHAVLSANPYMVKPNLDELQEWHGAPLADDGAILAAARRLMAAGPLVVVVSLGPGGLLLVSSEGSWRAVPPPVKPVNTVGSGDSLVAGFAAGLVRGIPAPEVLRLAVACGTANALTHAVAVVRPDDLERIRSQVRVERLA